MSAGYRAGTPGELGFLIDKIAKLEDKIAKLEKTRSSTIVGLTSNSVILADSNGVQWRLGVTTAGATTWTQV